MPPATQSPIRRSPLHHWHVAHGARFVERDGWLLPSTYGNPREEADAARKDAGVVDVSALAKWSLRGRGVPAVASALGLASPLSEAVAPTRGVAALRSAAVIGDGSITACWLAEQSLMLLSSTTRLVEPAALSEAAHDVVRTDITSAYAGFAVVGELAKDVTGHWRSYVPGLGAFPYGSCMETAFAGWQALLVRPPAGFVDQILVYVAWDVGEYVWELLCERGEFNAIPIGIEALGILRSAKS